MSKVFWRWTKNEVSSENSELIIEGDISSTTWYGDESTPRQLREELAGRSGDLTVHIDSPGGDVWAGISMFNALKKYDGKVTIVVDSLAASIASVIAMAGDEIIMSEGSMLLIHKPWTMIVGNSDDMRDMADYLEKLADNLVDIYVNRTGKSKEEILAMLDGEGTWMSAQEAVEYGFADKAEGAKPTLSEAIKNSLKYTQPVQAAIMQPMMSLKKVLNNTQDETKEEAVEDDAATTKPVDETVEQVEQTQAPVEATENEVATVETVETEGSDETEAVEVSEPTVEENNSDEVKETKEMAHEDIAKAQVQAPAVEAVAKPSVKDYLNNKASVQDFANILAQNAGKEAADVKAAWQSFVETKMAVTNPEALLPAAVITAIEDAFKEGGEIWNAVAKTGLTAIVTALDTVTGEGSRAKGHKRGDDKVEEVITIATRTVRAQFVYKYLTLDKEIVRENQDTGALLRYVLTELPKRVVRELERAIIIGDGRSAPGGGQPDTRITSFVSVKADATAGNAYASTLSVTAGEGAYSKLVRALAEVKADGVRYLVAKSGFMTDALLEQGVNGGFLFAPGTDLAAAFRLGGIITPDWMDADADNDAYVVVLSQYKTVGDTTVENFANFVLKENKNEYLSEIYAGGALGARKAAVAIAAESAS